MTSGSAPRAAARRPAPARLTYSVGRLERAVRRRLAEVTRRFGLTVAEYTALSVLAVRGTLSNAQLARRSLVSAQAMNELVQAMAEKRMVERRPHSRHGRIVEIRLTGQGERVLRRCGAAARRIERIMLGRLSRAERARFGEFLRRCIEQLEGPRRAGRAARGD